jgi:hypothetical protein
VKCRARLRSSAWPARGKSVADAFPERYIYYQGDAAKIRVKTAEYSGKPVSEKVTLKFIEQKYEKKEKEEEYNGYKYKTVDYILHERELASADVNTDSQGNGSYDFTVPSPGSIYVKAIVYEKAWNVVNRGGSFWAPDKKGESTSNFAITTRKRSSWFPTEILQSRRDGARPGDAAHRQSAPARHH